jgi:membrane protein DedA with SNARE-associated domain
MMHAFEKKIITHPYTTVILSRFGSSITPIVSYLSGLAKMHHRTYLISVIIGEIGDTAVICALSYFFGANWTAIENVMSEIISAIVLIVLLFIALRWNTKRRGKISEKATSASRQAPQLTK